MLLSDVQNLLIQFRSAFTRQKIYCLFVAVMVGFLCCEAEKHVTGLCLSARKLGGTKVARYWSFCKFFSRRQWSVFDLMKSFLVVLLQEFNSYRIILDATATTTQGRRQQWRHYRPNTRYKKCYDNQSKWLAGNSALSLGFVGVQHTPVGKRCWTIAVGAVRLNPANKRQSERAVAVRTLKALALPRGCIVITDKLYSDALTVNRLTR